MWIWIGAGVVFFFFVLDWLIVMGINPKKWKGGEINDQHTGID